MIGRRLATIAIALFSTSATAQAKQQFLSPIPSSQQADKPIRQYPVLHPFGAQDEWERAFRSLLAHHKLKTLPLWTRGFHIKGKSYSYSLVGSAPAGGRKTIIPTVIVPIRLTISDFSADGAHPIVLDATKIVKHILASPLFQAVPANGNRQFADGMLHAEFPHHARGWSTVLSPTVAPTLDIVAPPGTVKVIKSKSGNFLGIVEEGSVVNHPIAEAAQNDYSAQELPIFVTYNSLLRSAFGYHFFKFRDSKAEATAYIYSSWLEHVNDALGERAPDAVTLSHEIAETIHDPVYTSVTRPWGDPFGKNRCFDYLIEVGDAIEFAPFKIQYYKEIAMLDGRQKVYTLQNEALLPWFERQTPSLARDHAYSYPSETALTEAAPFNCVK